MRALQVLETPVQRAEKVSTALGCEVWIKRDDLTHATYGGNKVRKLARLLEQARTLGATDIVTIGAVGSHHVFATILYGHAVGIDVHGVMVAQPHTPHVEQMARADLAQGGTLIPARAAWEVPVIVAREALRLRVSGRRPMVIPMGGSTPTGAMGYVDGVRELSSQIARGDMPGWPDVIVAALGSGGTVAGIVVGTRMERVPTRVVGVQVTERWMPPPPVVRWMANATQTLATQEGLPDAHNVHADDFDIDLDQLGAGYGHPTPAAREAQALFAQDGIVLDLTYTAKAAAGLIAMARRDTRPRRYLYWHTLSSAPMEPLLHGAPDLPPAIRALMR